MVAFPQETLIQIFEDSIDDSPKTKYISARDLLSFMLVNHDWHRAASEILWREPFLFIKETYTQRNESRVMKQHSSLVATYLQCLPKVIKNRISKQGISLDSVSKKSAIFEYPAMLKRLDWSKLHLS
ncbi:9603_t:CDS:1, partial [Acaulospora colombiana]